MNTKKVTPKLITVTLPTVFGGKYPEDTSRDYLLYDDPEVIWQSRPLQINWIKARENNVESLVEKLEAALITSQGLIKFLQRHVTTTLLTVDCISAEEAEGLQEHVYYEIDIANSLIKHIYQLTHQTIPSCVTQWEDIRKPVTVVDINTMLLQLVPCQVERSIAALPR